MLFRWMPVIVCDDHNGRQPVKQAIISIKELEPDWPRYMAWKAWIEREQIKARIWHEHYCSAEKRERRKERR